MHQRVDFFKLWCWIRLLRVPRVARRSKQSVLKEINPEWLLEALMLKLKLHYFGHLMQTADSLEKSLMLGKTEGRKRRLDEDEMIRWHHLLKGHEFEQTLRDGEGLEGLVCCSSLGHKSWTRLSNWTATTCKMHVKNYASHGISGQEMFLCAHITLSNDFFHCSFPW